MKYKKSRILLFIYMFLKVHINTYKSEKALRDQQDLINRILIFLSFKTYE